MNDLKHKSINFEAPIINSLKANCKIDCIPFSKLTIRKIVDKDDDENGDKILAMISKL